MEGHPNSLQAAFCYWGICDEGKKSLWLTSAPIAGWQRGDSGRARLYLPRAMSGI